MNPIGNLGELIVRYQYSIEIVLLLILAAIVVVTIVRNIKRSSKDKDAIENLRDTVKETAKETQTIIRDTSENTGNLVKDVAKVTTVEMERRAQMREEEREKKEALEKQRLAEEKREAELRRREEAVRLSELNLKESMQKKFSEDQYERLLREIERLKRQESESKPLSEATEPISKPELPKEDSEEERLLKLKTQSLELLCEVAIDRLKKEMADSSETKVQKPETIDEELETESQEKEETFHFPEMDEEDLSQSQLEKAFEMAKNEAIGEQEEQIHIGDSCESMDNVDWSQDRKNFNAQRGRMSEGPGLDINNFFGGGKEDIIKKYDSRDCNTDKFGKTYTKEELENQIK